MAKTKTKFTFDEKTHSYYIDGKPLTGVTTILRVIAKPALIQWAANMAVKYVEDNLKDIDDLPEVLKEAKTAHRKKKEQAGDIGTDVHQWVEDWIKGKNPEIPEDKQARKMIENFLKWAKGKKFISSEIKVYSEKYWYAGTFDFLVEIDGKKYIGDLKTSNGIYGREYFAQMAAYRLALEEMGLANDIEGSVVVRCGKRGDFEEKYSYDYDTDRDIFLACLKLYRGLQTFEIKK